MFNTQFMATMASLLDPEAKKRLEGAAAADEAVPPPPPPPPPIVPTFQPNPELMPQIGQQPAQIGGAPPQMVPTTFRGAEPPPTAAVPMPDFSATPAPLTAFRGTEAPPASPLSEITNPAPLPGIVPTAAAPAFPAPTTYRDSLPAAEPLPFDAKPVLPADTTHFGVPPIASETQQNFGTPALESRAYRGELPGIAEGKDVLNNQGAQDPSDLAEEKKGYTPEEAFKKTQKDYNPKPIWERTRADGTVEQTTERRIAKLWGDKARLIQGVDRNKKWSLLEKIGGAALGWAQGGLMGGIRGATDRNFFNKQRDAFERSELLPQIAANQQMEKHKADVAWSKTRSDVAAGNLDVKRQTQDMKGLLDFQKLFPEFDPKKATPNQVKMLADRHLTPEDIGRYNRKIPKTVKFGDTMYAWSDENQSWIDAPGIAKDPSKTIVEITAQDPVSKQTYKFLVPQDKAAGYINQRVIQGLAIKAASERQATQQEFQGAQNELNRAQTRTLAQDRLKLGRDALALQERRLALAEEHEKAGIAQKIFDAKLALGKFKGLLVANPLIGADDPMVTEDLADIEAIMPK